MIWAEGRSLLLAAGYFPESIIDDAWEEATDYAVREGQRGHPLRTDLPVFDLPVPPWTDGIDIITRNFWSRFEKDFDYYSYLIFRSSRVHVLAFARAADHRDRVNIISCCCALWEKPLTLHLF